MEKRISTTQLRAAKRVAATVASNIAKRDKAKQQILKWTEEYNRQEGIIVGYETGLMMDIGLRSEQIVTKVTEPTGKFDKNGKEIKQTKYIINDNVKFDSDTKEYIVTIDDKSNEEKVSDDAEKPADEQDLEQLVEASAEQPVTEEQEPITEEASVDFEEMFNH